MHKSTSFFERVDAVEAADAPAAAPKAKKQTTLFGMAPPAAQDKSKRTPRAKAAEPASSGVYADTEETQEDVRAALSRAQGEDESSLRLDDASLPPADEDTQMSLDM